MWRKKNYVGEGKFKKSFLRRWQVYVWQRPTDNALERKDTQTRARESKPLKTKKKDTKKEESEN